MHMNRSVLYALLFSSAIVYTTCGGSPLPTHKSSDTGSPLPDGSEESEASESVDSVPVASLRLKTVLGSSQLQPMQGITPLIYSYLKAGLNSYASTKLPGVNLAHPNSIHYEVLLDGETDLPPNEINNEEIDPLPSHFMEYGRGVYELHYPFRFMPGEKYKERSHAICADTCSGSPRLTLNSSEPLDRSQTHFEIYTVHKNQRQDTLFGIGPVRIEVLITSNQADLGPSCVLYRTSTISQRFMFIRHLVFFNPNPNEPAAVGVTEIIYPWQSHQ